MTLRTGSFLVAGLLGLASSTTAFAQPPAPPPAGPPAPTPDRPQAEQELPPRVPWRGTELSWTNAATTTMLGIGRDNISDSHEAFGMIWMLKLNYFLVDQEKWSIALTTAPAMAVELTNSDDTTTEREPWFLDLPVLATYKRSLLTSGLWTTNMALGTGLVFPTSPYSAAIGTKLMTTERLTLVQGIPLFGKKAPALQSFNLTLSGRWDHRFGTATTPVNDELNWLRQDRSGNTLISDQLTFTGVATNTLREGVQLSFNETPGGMPLSLGLGFSFAQSFLPTFNGGDCVVEIDTGCVAEPEPSVPVRTARTSYAFGVSLDWQPVPEAGVGLAYASSSSPLGSDTLAPDGQRRSIFYSPTAELSGTITFYPDALFERMTGPRRALAEKRDRKRGKL